MKTIVKSLVMNSLIASAILVSTACSKDMGESSGEQYATVLNVETDGTSAMVNENLEAVIVPTVGLSETEMAALLKMKEEEKLARDVYSALYAKWGATPFTKIGTAEEKHMTAVLTLLKTYGASDTLIADAGVFTTEEFTNLYTSLVTAGSVTLEDAYKTGALIEEMDISDLTDLLSTTTNENMVIVFENLLKGSRNHLRAFNRQLTIAGVNYVPQYLDQASYDQIVNSSMEKGKQYKMKNNGNGKGKGNKGGKGNGTCSN